MNIRELLRAAADRDRLERAELLDPDVPLAAKLKTMRQLEAKRKQFYEAIDTGDRDRALRLADLFLDFVETPVERARWRAWKEALSRSGGRVKVATFPVKIIAGDDLAALDALRTAETPADLLEDE